MILRELVVHWNFFSKRFTDIGTILGHRLAQSPDEDVAAHRVFLLCHILMWTLAADAFTLAVSILLPAKYICAVLPLGIGMIMCDSMACLDVFLNVRQDRFREARELEARLVEDVLES